MGEKLARFRLRDPFIGGWPGHIQEPNVPPHACHVRRPNLDFPHLCFRGPKRTVIKRVKPILEDTVKAFYTKSLYDKFAIVDMGCSSGPNALEAISIIINKIFTLSKEKGQTFPELLVFLNDLPGNDFNNIFKSLPQFYKKLKEQTGLDLGTCFISGMPGTFYGRLFPIETLDFVHSSCSLHWLSQGLIEEANVDSFNIPFYTPFSGEVTDIVGKEGSFKINNLKTFELNWDSNGNDENQDYAFDMKASGEFVACCVRAASESTLASHFGEAIIDELFLRYARNVGDHLSKEKTKYILLVISMSKKS
uniref:Uncharacterized protein n=1 Tax=Manihot esculenta TaxID=3983 RepID=A0A2C9V470_MANES